VSYKHLIAYQVEEEFVKDQITVTKETRVESVRKISKLALFDFPHLHLHDEYSFRDGMSTLKKRVKFMFEHNWTYLTATNHASLGGWIKQYFEAKKYDLKPIFGVEAYINNYRNIAENTKGMDEETKKLFAKNNHQILLARTLEGWKNIIMITNDANINGFFSKPRTDKAFMLKHAKGVIATSTDGYAGEIPQLLMNKELSWEARVEQAKMLYEEYNNAFDGFYLELNLLDMPEQAEINRALITFGEEVGAKYVITGDCHYLHKEDAETHGLLLLVNDKKTVVDRAINMAYRQLKSGKSFEEAAAVGYEYLTNNNFELAAQEFITRVTSEDKLKDAAWEFHPQDLYVKTLDELFETWKILHGDDTVFTEELFWRAAKDTRDLARSVESFDIDTSIKLPKLAEDSDEKLREEVEKGLKKLKLYGIKEYMDRLDYEMGVVKQLGFCDYFLVFQKIVQYCNEKDIAIGSSRGSAGGCLISYALGITKLDPIEYNLLFERFLDPGRSDAPDIDCDFDQRYREQVCEGIVELFGKNHVCSIGSYQMMKTKTVIKDIARAFCIPPKDVNILTKKLKGGVSSSSEEQEDNIDKLSWEEVVELNPELQEFLEKYPYVGEHCKRLRGQIRNRGKHPAGMIIASIDLNEEVPLFVKDGAICSQWTEGLDLKEMQEIGLIKYDILGLRTVSIIDEAVKNVARSTVLIKFGKIKYRLLKSAFVEVEGKEKRACEVEKTDIITAIPRVSIKLNNNEVICLGKLVKCNSMKVTGIAENEIDLTQVPMENKRCLRRLNNLDTIGIFQFETNTAEMVIKTIGIDAFKDMYIATALGRPDPLSGDLHIEYALRKKGKKEYEEIPCLGSFNQNTYSLPVFQENSMIFARKIAGFSASEANKLRKGLAKGKDNDKAMKILQDMLKKIKEQSQPSVKKGLITQDQLDSMIDIMSRFGGYGFNASHSVGYAMLAYWSLFLKEFFPKEFMASIFNYQENVEAKISTYIRYCESRGIHVFSPNINKSDENFSFDEDGIYWGLSKIKNVGEKAAQAIIEARDKPYDSLEDFYERVDKRRANKKAVEMLIAAGAFDEFADGETVWEKRSNMSAKYAELRKKKDEAVTYTKDEIRKLEIDLIGSSLSIKLIEVELDGFYNISNMADGKTGLFLVHVDKVEPYTSKGSGKKHHKVTVSDNTGSTTFFVWGYTEDEFFRGQKPSDIKGIYAINLTNLKMVIDISLIAIQKVV